MTITDPHEVIAAFVDGERVNAAALKAALSQPDGRDYLVDLSALREVVAHDVVHAPAGAATRPARRWLVAAAAAVVLSLVGGYTIGHRSAAAAVTLAATSGAPENVAAPAPTRVIEVTPGYSHIANGGQ
jgi:hypothetical protein